MGLGKMGFNLALNLKDHNHEVIGFDLNEEILKNMEKEGVHTEGDVDQFLNALEGRKVIWLMIPAGKPTEDTIQMLQTKLSEGDIIVDGGNSNWHDTVRRAKECNEKGILYLDCGTSGGTSGARNGACMMIGGDKEAFELLEDVFLDSTIKDGCAYVGKAGSGHFMKMVHNGVEYGMMQAIGEGFQILEDSQFDYDLEQVAHNWNNGSVIRGWLMEIAEDMFGKDPHLDDIRGYVDVNGEAKWTVEAALDQATPAPVIALSLMMRDLSREDDSFSAKVVASLRNGFGGHAVHKK